ncbi:hypothetical protein ABBQ32_012968 [Trebouxia sp. C0010 RCD-2024]
MPRRAASVRLALPVGIFLVVTLAAFRWAAPPSVASDQDPLRPHQLNSISKWLSQEAEIKTVPTQFSRSFDANKRSARESFGPKKANLTRQDLLVAIPSSSDRLALVRGSRKWRRGVPSWIITEMWSDPGKLTRQAEFEGEKLERHGEWREAWGCMKIGDVRAGVTPFLAAHLHGYDNFKWMLYGDDDTVFFIDNALDMLEGLDHNMPYFLTDHLWFPDQFDGRRGEGHRKMHPNRAAPRCLPCGYQDPFHAPNGTSAHVPTGSYRAPEGCPCNVEAVCKGADNPGFWGAECQWHKFAHPGWWYFEHGGAGAILSVGLLRSIEWAKMEKRFDVDGGVSGDSQFMAAVFEESGILPTDPGYGFYRPQMTLFDPGWRGEQTKGPEDWGVADLGNDPMGIIDRLQYSLNKGHCSKDCEDSLQHMISSHIRARYAIGDVLPDEVQNFTYTGAEEHRATVYIQHRLSTLFQEYMEKTGFQRD